MTMKRFLALWLCFVLLLLIPACRSPEAFPEVSEGSEQGIPERDPSGWDEFLERIIDPETQTFQLPDGDIWYASSDEILQQLQLSEDEVKILGNRSTEFTRFLIAPPTVILPEQNVSCQTFYSFLLDHLEGETIQLSDMTSADVQTFLEHFQVWGRQIPYNTDANSSTLDSFLQGITDKSSLDFAALPAEERAKQSRETISWTDKNSVCLSVEWSILYDSEDAQNQSVVIKLTTDLTTFYNAIGYVPPTRTAPEVTPSKKSNTPFKDWADLFDGLLAEDGTSFCFGPTPLLSSMETAFETQGTTMADYQNTSERYPADEHYASISAKEEIAFQEMDLRYRVFLGFHENQLVSAHYFTENPDRESLIALCDKLEKWSEPFSLTSSQTVADLREALEQEGYTENPILLIWEDSNGVELQLTWQDTASLSSFLVFLTVL